MRLFLRQLTPALVVLAFFTVLCGVVYPLVVTGFAQVAFGDRADGSLVRSDDGTVVGSRLLGQTAASAQYLHPRPSAAGDGYDGAASSGSNLGPNNPDLLAAVADRVAAYRVDNGLPEGAEVPVDAVTASGSGLDPHISLANARLQAPRVAAARGLTTEEVWAVVLDHVDGRTFGVLGEPGVDVLTTNLALDRLDLDRLDLDGAG
jgi:K+-transporting ATPase ATPase C chain